ncbi:Uncharacterised protein [Mycobacteroides abscessus subsp. abscessus]|nr:Uncharacterised protein [Mycobacteroides abscessus subsp. abscessus]
MILPPFLCTALVTIRCRYASREVVSLPASGLSHAVRLMAYPPVMIMPTPPLARSAK